MRKTKQRKLLQGSPLFMIGGAVAGGIFLYNYRKLKVGASFTSSQLPEGWLPPLNYDFYLQGDYISPVEVVQHLHKHNKYVGVVIVQDPTVRPWPSIGAIESILGKYGEYCRWCITKEDAETDMLQELNDTYDYIKEHYPWIDVYQAPKTYNFDYFSRLGELKADGFLISPRWLWAGGRYGHNFYENHLKPALDTGKKVINLLYVAAGADAPQYAPPGYPEMTTWEYCIGQYYVCKKYKVPVMIYQAFWPGYEELLAERWEIIKNGGPTIYPYK